jgi:tripartite-type tricarboxylate transporter receptor subunit TctC
MLDRRCMLSFLTLLLANVGGITAAPAQEKYQDKYPSRPIRLLVPFPAGGPTDVMGRLIAQSLSSTLGQQVIVENRPGGGSTLAARAAATAEPDGYTLLLASAASLAIGPALYPNSGYDPATSFASVGAIATVPYVMVAGPGVTAKTVPELVAYAKANPGKLNIGVPNGAPPHMIAAWFRALTNTDVMIVPYKGASNALTDLIGGQIDLAIETTSVTFGHLHDGKLRPLGVTTAQRLPDLPDVPTMIEGGVPDFITSSWTGMMAPAGTPKAIISRLNADINAGLKSPELQDRLKKLAAAAMPGTPEEFAAFVVREVPKWQAMVKLAGVKAD